MAAAHREEQLRAQLASVEEARRKEESRATELVIYLSCRPVGQAGAFPIGNSGESERGEAEGFDGAAGGGTEREGSISGGKC